MEDVKNKLSPDKETQSPNKSNFENEHDDDKNNMGGEEMFKNTEDNTTDDNVYECDLCENKISFDSADSLTIHILTIHTNQFKCETCDESFKNYHLLEKHKRKVHDTAPNHHKCKSENCNEMFDTEELMQEHFQICRTIRKCVACGKVFSRAKQLKLHIQVVHEGKKIYQCEMNDCGKSFVDARGLKEHIGYTHEGQTCKKCQATFTDKSELRDHIKLMHSYTYTKENLDEKYEEKYQQKCDKCGKKRKNLKNHKCVLEGGEKTFKCDECGKIYPKPDSLKYHIAVVHEGTWKDKICPSCGKAFHMNNVLQHHIAFVHEGKRNHQCESCGKAFVLPQQLKKHIFEKHEDHPDKKCPQCNLIFMNDKVMKRHILLTHEGRKDHVCESCGKAFANNYSLVKHVDFNHKGLKYVCESCGKTFITVSAHKKHVNNVHKGLGKKYPCKRCEEIFYTALDLKRHRVAKHMDCETCGKKFEGPNAARTLSSHIRLTHKKIKKYSCDICGKSFGSSSDMKRHVDSVHLKKPVWQNIRKNYPGGKKPVVEKTCEFCGDTFSHSILLRKHISLNHRDLIKFECRICFITFATKPAFLAHLQNTHENDTYQCKICQQSFKLDLEKETRARAVMCYETQKCFSCIGDGPGSQRYTVIT